jgi:HlyD family secretion protein
VLSVALISYVVVSNYAGGKQPAEPAAKPQTAVAALGRIEPGSEIINLGAGISPDRLEELFVARGDVVKQGQVLARLGGYAEQITQRGVLEQQLKEAKLRAKTELTLNQTRVKSAEIRKRQVHEVSPLRIAAQEANIASLEAKLANDRDILSSQDQLFERGISARRTRADQQAAVAQGEANVASARAQLAQLKQQFEVDKVDADMQITLARAQLERAEAEFPIASLEAQIAHADAQAHRMTIYAPIRGRILNVRVKPGEEVGSGPVLVMGDTDKMRAVAEVYETDIGRVTVGQSATITSRALPRPLTGKVMRIGNLVFKNDVLNIDPAARADARVVEVWIELDEPAMIERLTNLTVDVTINAGDPPAAVARSGRP